MKQVAYLQISKYRRKYNDVVRKKLEQANIKFVQQSVKFGYKLMVNETDFSAASRIILGISLTNPKY
jgi:hypothetical protein